MNKTTAHFTEQLKGHTFYISVPVKNRHASISAMQAVATKKAREKYGQQECIEVHGYVPSDDPHAYSEEGQDYYTYKYIIV